MTTMSLHIQHNILWPGVKGQMPYSRFSSACWRLRTNGRPCKRKAAGKAEVFAGAGYGENGGVMY